MSTPRSERRIDGAGRFLVLLYGIFALAATARAGVQIATKFEQAPVAYLLSAGAALIYLANCIMFSRASTGAWRMARVLCLVELTGVLVVGTASVIVPEEFPDATVWSQFGLGYGLVPLILPVLGLAWLGRTRPEEA